MYKTFNKGEWTEIYVLFYLLGTGKLYKGDFQFKIILNSFYNINKILRLENLDNLEFTIQDTESKIIISRNGKDTKIIPMSDFIDKANNLIKEIRNNSNTFALPKVEDFLKSIHCVSIKSSSKNIKDIEVEIIDHDIQASEKLSFSIKSKLGSSPTIFNANLKTSFIYQIEGINKQEVKELNQLSSGKQILKKIRNNKLIIFDEVKTNNYTEILYRNLVLVDSQMPVIVSSLLLNFYSDDKSNIVDLHRKIVLDNPCNYQLDNINDIYERKIKDFLNSITLGLRASENWKTEEAPNGFLVVRQDGEIVSYHLLDRKIFEDCLFHQTKLDSPSSTRHKYGKIYEENNQFYIKLCLQVRFK
nr:HpaII family restriction endonuclease [Chroococcus sp. FPU101]